MKPSSIASTIKRREFLAASAAATITIVKPSLVRGTQANSELRIGVIGNGGRGTWIADLFQKTGKYKVIANADYFDDRATAFGEKYKVDAARRFSTLSGYKKMLELKDVDVAVLETPPYFRPAQAAAAVDAGKHVFAAKPMAVDVPGCLSIAESGKKASEKKLVFLIDFQTRANDNYRETLKRVKQGAIGKLISAEATYPWSVTVHDNPIQTPDDRIRYWYATMAIGGDSIVEQSIHALDVACWFADADPIQAFGTGGTAVRKYGDIYDHNSILFFFPNDFAVSFTDPKDVPGAPDIIGCRVYGTEGVANTDYSGDVNIQGKHPFPGGRTPDIFASGCVHNINEFYDAVTSGRFENTTVPPSVRSNLTCILGRTAAHKKALVTWKEIMDARETLTPDLSGLKS